MKIIAHRGFSSKYPENTMIAFKKAEEAKAFGIELDVHMTKDKKIVICHDETIDRTSDGMGYIKDLTLEEIRKFSFINKKEEFKKISVGNKDFTAPSLEEFLSWLKNTTMMVNIEIKNNIFRYEGIVDEVLRLIKINGLEDRIIISSFNHHTIREVKEKSSLPCGFLTECSLLNPGDYCKQYGVEYYHPLFITLDKEDLINLKENGVGINTWTVDGKNHVLLVKEMEVNSIITNDPEETKKILEEIN